MFRMKAVISMASALLLSACMGDEDTAESSSVQSSASLSDAPLSSTSAMSSAADVAAIDIPKRIQSEDFSRAKDNTPTNEGGCGTGPVDQYPVPQGFLGLCDVGGIEAGEWLEYDIRVAEAGTYTFIVNVAAPSIDTRLILHINGVEIGQLQTANDAAKNYEQLLLPNIVLEAGTQTLRLSFTSTTTLLFNYVEVNLVEVPSSSEQTSSTMSSEGSSTSSVMDMPSSSVTSSISQTSVSSAASSSVSIVGDIANGQDLYKAKCAGCHDDSISPVPGTATLGGFPGSNIIDENGQFACELTVCTDMADLADYITRTMPFGSTASCEDSCALDIAQYISQTFERDMAALDKVAFVTRFPRLTHVQWRNSIKDIFGLTNAEVNVVALSPDAPEGHYQNNARRTFIRQELLADYDTAIKIIAETLTQDRATIANFTGALPATDIAAAIVNSVSPKLYRRPITGVERTELINLFNQGREAYAALDDQIVAGTRLLLTGLLQSPHFLYRVEKSQELDAVEGLIPLNDYEIAVRLSYAILNSTPDTALMAAAENGELTTPEGLDTQINRLLSTNKGKGMVRDFHGQTVGTDKLYSLMKDPVLYPDFDPNIGGDMANALKRFTQAIVHDDNGSLRDLLLTPTAFVNPKLAPLYGVGPVGDEGLTRVDLNANQRAGLLTQVGFLALNASEKESDPIHRGVFVQERMICRALGSPPNNVPPVPNVETQTQRERLDLHTKTCGGVCHVGLINNAGFALEGYGALGEARTKDTNGFMIDAMSSLVLDGDEKEYDGAVEFSQALANAKETHDCYSTQWIEYALGRDITPSDKPLKDALTELSFSDNQPIIDLIKMTLLSEAFRFRATDDKAGE